uniref:Uncharacterized protein n=1 Tax=Romanomermis culicivorax TaxID=13658 RepID=A0A915JZD3_ROMCU
MPKLVGDRVAMSTRAQHTRANSEPVDNEELTPLIKPEPDSRSSISNPHQEFQLYTMYGLALNAENIKYNNNH